MSNISLIVQAGTLKSYFPESTIVRDGDKEISWVQSLTPSPLSATYKIKLHYKKGSGIKVYVIDPMPLIKAKGELLLPHVYSTKDQRLCLYYPLEKEWTPKMLYVKTIIPWTCEWLVHYEIWVATGSWCGGGVDHNAETDKTETE